MPLASEHVSRRSFLQAGAASAGLALAAPAFGRSNAGERLNVGLIGSGSRGTAMILEAVKQGHNCVALADVGPFRMERTADQLGKAGHRKPKFFDDHRRLLDERDLDAVIIASPDHWHHDMLLDAVAAGKDVYIEKPLSRTIDEGRSMIDAVRKTKCIVQVGNQRHSGDHWQRARDAIQSSDFGSLAWVKVWDTRNWITYDPFAPPKDHAKLDPQVDWQRFLGSAPKRPFDPYRYWAWRWFWDYAGGLMTDIGAHHLDLVQWLGGQEKGPKSVVANGGRYHFSYWETPDVVHAVLDYDKFAATFAVEFVNGFDGSGAAFYGTKRTLIANTERDIRLYDTADQPRKGQEPIEVWPVRYEGPAHMKNWFECCKTRKEPNSTVELGHQVITAAHLANLAYRSGRRVNFNPEKGQVVSN